MSKWTDLSLPTERAALVAFYDLTGFTAFSSKHAPLDVLDILSGYFTITGEIISARGGKLIKTLGDAGLCVFLAEDADDGILALRDVQRVGDRWLATKSYKARTKVKVNAGPVAFGMVGAPGSQVFDVYGKTVNVAAVLESHTFAMTAAAFRSLSAGTRKLFKKHTPPVSYIALEDSHAAS